MKTLIALLLCFAFAPTISAQEIHIYPIRWWPNDVTDPDVFSNPRAAGWMADSNSEWMRKYFEPTEIACPSIAFGVVSTNGQPVAAPHAEANSVSFWLRAPDTVTVEIEFGEFNANNTGTIRTLVGPFDWQQVTVPLIGGERTALYYCLTIPYLDTSFKFENRYNAKVYMGPVTLQLAQASVAEEHSAPKKPTEFIDVLGRPTKPSNIYKLLPDGRALVW